MWKLFPLTCNFKWLYVNLAVYKKTAYCWSRSAHFANSAHLTEQVSLLLKVSSWFIKHLICFLLLNFRLIHPLFSSWPLDVLPWFSLSCNYLLGILVFFWELCSEITQKLWIMGSDCYCIPAHPFITFWEA